MNHDELFWAILKALIAFEIIKAAIDAALAAITEAMPAEPLDFATDHTSHINLMGGIGDPDYMKGSLSIRHIDTR